VRTVQEYIDRFAATNLCPGCGQALHTTQRLSDRHPVLSEA
jgi:hypothetical protein